MPTTKEEPMPDYPIAEADAAQAKLRALETALNDPVIASLRITPQIHDTMVALLDANPPWRTAFNKQPRFSGDLVLITRAIVGVLNGAADIIPIEELDLSVRAYNVLKREHVNTVGQLVTKSRDDLFDMRNMGEKATNEVEAKLAGFGRSLRQSS